MNVERGMTDEDRLAIEKAIDKILTDARDKVSLAADGIPRVTAQHRGISWADQKARVSEATRQEYVAERTKYLKAWTDYEGEGEE